MKKNRLEEQNFDIKTNIATNKNLTYFICFSFFLSCLYLFVFWSNFNINIFQHLTIQEILLRSITPILFFAFSMYVVLIGKAISKKNERATPSNEPVNPEEAEEGNKEEKPIIKHLINILLLAIIPTAAGAFFIYRREDPIGYMLYAYSVGGLALYSLTQSEVHKLFSKNEELSATLMVAIVFMTASTAGLAMNNAMLIKTGKTSFLISVHSTITNEKSLYRLIGEAGDQTFLWEEESETVIQINSSKIDLIKVKRYQPDSK